MEKISTINMKANKLLVPYHDLRHVLHYSIREDPESRSSQADELTTQNEADR